MDAYIQDELAAGRLIGHISPNQVQECHINPIGSIPKPHQPGRWRLIVDLSSPHGHSINDGISPPIHYASIDTAIELALELGSGAELAKFDLHSAYRFVPINPQDQHLLGIRWRDKVFLDSALP